jgi:purine-binding chemotaxis protein CheW
MLLNQQHYAVPLSEVREVLPAVLPIRPPHAPAILEGLINLRGSIVPILDLRYRLGLPPRPLRPSDHFVVVSAGLCDVALRVDRALTTITVEPADIEEAQPLTCGSPLVAGIVKRPDGLMLIYDLPAFLSETEARELTALAAQALEQ